MLKNLFKIALFFICPLSYADLGQIYVKSYLQQNLFATIPVTNISGNNVPVVEIATADQFRNNNINYNSDIGYLSSKLVKLNNSNYELHLASSKPINTPILDILLHYKIEDNDIYKQYTILLDPINLQSSQNIND